MSLQAKRYKKRKNKKYYSANQREHTIRRFRERFGINLSRHEYDGLIQQIRERRSLYICRLSNRLKNHFVECRGHLFVVGYDKRTKQIRTVLPVKTEKED